MLDPTIMETGTPRLTLKSVDLAPLIRAVIETFDPLGIGEPGLEQVAYASRSLRLDLVEGVTVRADEDRLRQVLINLLTNALKYSEPGSPLAINVVVEAPARSLGLPRWAAPAAAPAVAERLHKVARIGVRDSGLGVPPRDVSKLFQRFVRLERDITGPVRGTGVGLYLCRVLVEAMGGRIWVESTGVPGEGSTFCFTLPIVEMGDTTSG
jgi:signal transduction histidine kinase